jgi:choline dehydrogenase-like flavoprotein
VAAPPPTPLAPQAPLPVMDAAAFRAAGHRDLTIRADVAIVGSGAGGAVMAYEMAKAGKSVVVLEAGRYVPSTQFSEIAVDMFDKLFQDRGAQLNMDADIMVLQGRCVGGSTVINGAVCFRIPDHVLKVWQTDPRPDEPRARPTCTSCSPAWRSGCPCTRTDPTS